MLLGGIGMIEKVKVTQEEANEIGDIKDIAYAIAGLSTADLARALLIGYEIEPEPLKVGDWALFESLGDIWVAKIRNIMPASYGKEKLYLPDNEIHRLDSDRYYANVEKVDDVDLIKTEKERRKWAGIEEGDVLRGLKSGALAIFTRDFPQHQEVQVRVHDGLLQNWDKASVELYAKKVGASND